MRSTPLLSLSCGILLGLGMAASAFGKPPPWAPAHGYRAKYAGYSGHGWDRDYGVLGGRCNTDEILAAAGAVAGGVIANRTAPDNRTVATILGAVIGGVIGNEIGDRIDERDRACIGHSLELVPAGQSVRWENSASGLSYQLRPVRDLANGCREFELTAGKGKHARPAKLRGCARSTGSWSLE